MKNYQLILLFTNRINKRLVFKMKDRYNLQLQIPEIMKLFGKKKKKKTTTTTTDKKKNGQNLLNFEVV